MDIGIYKIQISQLDTKDKIPYDLLLLSDDTIEAIDKNLDNGELFTAKSNGLLVAAFILKAVEKDVIEIKNIAVAESMQGFGIGTVLLQYIINNARERNYKSLIVGTCDQCFKEIKFYQKSGFQAFAIRGNFFINNYTNSIFENGIQIRDMVMLQINLQQYAE